jgi:hypothetical protein
MSISDDLMMAIFAMDSYNRGYNPSLVLTGASLGETTLNNVELPSGFQANSFFAQAYTWNGKTVISYRGTEAATTPEPILTAVGCVSEA